MYIRLLKMTKSVTNCVLNGPGRNVSSRLTVTLRTFAILLSMCILY
jgi:hypothetical protein